MTSFNELLASALAPITLISGVGLLMPVSYTHLTWVRTAWTGASITSERFFLGRVGIIAVDPARILPKSRVESVFVF